MVEKKNLAEYEKSYLKRKEKVKDYFSVKLNFNIEDNKCNVLMEL